MALFAVTFRVMDGPRYDERYQSLTQAIEEIAGYEFWDEPTSFYLLESSDSSDDVRKAIVTKANLNKDDLVMVINLSQTKGHAASGVQDVPRFRKLMEKR